MVILEAMLTMEWTIKKLKGQIHMIVDERDKVVLHLDKIHAYNNMMKQQLQKVQTQETTTTTRMDMMKANVTTQYRMQLISSWQSTCK